MALNAALATEGIIEAALSTVSSSQTLTKEVENLVELYKGLDPEDAIRINNFVITVINSDVNVAVLIIGQTHDSCYNRDTDSLIRSISCEYFRAGIKVGWRFTKQGFVYTMVTKEQSKTMLIPRALNIFKRHDLERRREKAAPNLKLDAFSFTMFKASLDTSKKITNIFFKKTMEKLHKQLNEDNLQVYQDYLDFLWTLSNKTPAVLKLFYQSYVQYYGNSISTSKVLCVANSLKSLRTTKAPEAIIRINSYSNAPASYATIFRAGAFDKHPLIDYKQKWETLSDAINLMDTLDVLEKARAAYPENTAVLTTYINKVLHLLDTPKLTEHIRTLLALRLEVLEPVTSAATSVQNILRKHDEHINKDNFNN